MHRWSPHVLVFVAIGALVGWLVGGVVPRGLREPFLHRGDFHLKNKPGERFEITEARWMFLPLQFADFDLQMDVELGPGAELDVLVRQVEPRVVDEEMLPFAGRFAVLRLSTGKEGPGWRSRDDLMLGAPRGGVGVAPEIAASVWIEARGRRLTANVAGKPQGTFVADDEYGMLAMVVHGGNATVHKLDILDKGQPRAFWWHRATWIVAGALGACLLALVAHKRGAGLQWFVTAGVPMLVLAWLASRRADLDLAYPPPSALLAMLAGCLFAAAACLCRARLLFWMVCGAAALALAVADRQLRHDTRAIEAMFGKDAGSQISEAHAQLVRDPDVVTSKGLVRGALLDVGQPGKRVFLLGGNQLWGRETPDDHVAMLLRRELAAATRQKVQVPSLPTEDGHARQQVDLFLRCFTGYRPSVLVLGVAADEMAIDERTHERRSSPELVHLALVKAKTWCDANACKLVLFADSRLPAELHNVLREAAAGGVPLVQAIDGAAQKDIARQLAAVVAPLLSP